MAELAAWRASAAGGGCSELDKAQRKEYAEPTGDGRRLCGKPYRVNKIEYAGMAELADA